MKYLFILLSILIGTSLYSQDLKQFKNSQSIKISIKNDTTINTNDKKFIKSTIKELNNIKYFSLNHPEQWFKESDWLINIIFDSTKKFTFYKGGYIKINNESFYISQDEIEKFKNKIK